jgi:predicted MFS family arabinose efflux permease
VVITPIIVGLTTLLGFRFGVWVASGLLLALIVSVLPFLRRRPEDLGLLPDGAIQSHAPAVVTAAAQWDRRALFRDPAFVTVSTSFALGLIAQVGFFTHQFSYLRQYVDAQPASFAVSATTVAAIVGRTFTGFVVDRLDARMVSAGNFALQMVALALALLVETPAAVVLACVLFGLGAGNVITLPSLIVQREFPREQFSRIVSLIVSVNQYAFAFGPAILGALRDWSGNYRASFLLCIFLQGVGAAVVLLGRRHRRPESATPRRIA